MAAPIGSRVPSRLPGLDGIRFVAVALVLAYHGGVPGVRVAGYFGVDVFFVLSGYLITSLLLSEQAGAGGIALARFWGRRARRLLPALLVVLVACALYVSLVAPAGRYPGFREDALSVLAYVSNWHFISSSSDYFAATGAPSLLTHTWSLAIEEQFYVLWPLLLWGAGLAARRWSRSPALVVLALSGAGAVASAAEMAWLFRSGAPPSRLYYGTDTHAQSILVGAALASFLAWRSGTGRPVRPSPAALGVGGAAALGALLWAASTLGSSDPWTYQGGFLGVGILSAVLVAAVACPPPGGTGAAGRILGWRPCAYVGRISYGMYLWYFPLFAVIDHSSTGMTGAGLFCVRVAADLAAAALSHHLLEAPVLRSRWTGVPVLPRVRRGRLGWGAVMAMSAVTVGGLVAAAAPPSGPPAALASALQASAAPVPGQAPVPGRGDPSAPRPLRLLVTGDSTAMTLGLALASPPVQQRYGLLVDDAARMGCGVAVAYQVDEHGTPRVPESACDSSTPASGQWPALLRRDVQSFRPDAVLIAAGRWELASRRDRRGGPWIDILHPADAAYVRAQLEQAAAVAGATGAKVLLATAPCYASGEQPDGSPWPEDSPARLAAYNAAVRAAAGSTSSGVVDLDALLCPGGSFHRSIGGVVVRAPDGVHYPFFSFSAPAAAAPDTEAQTEAFAEWITPLLIKQL